MIHPWTHKEHAATFLGLSMAQRWVDFAVWERVFNSSKWRKGLIELGTGYGAFSMFLLLQCVQRGMTFHTFDCREAIPDEAAVRLLQLNSHFHLGGIFDDNLELLTKLIQSPELHPLILFCDNGWKQEEFRVFAPLLKDGDVVAVHDWGVEFFEKYTAPMEGRIEPLFPTECDEVGSITRFWNVRS